MTRNHAAKQRTREVMADTGQKYTEAQRQMSKPVRAAGLARNDTIDVQHERIAEFCRAKGWELVRWADDRNIPGSVPLFERPVASQLFEPGAPEWDVLVIAEPTHVTRLVSDWMTLQQWVTAHGRSLEFVSGGDEIPAQATGNEVSALALMMIYWCAEREDQTRHETLDAIRAMLALGDDGTRKRIFDWYGQGLSLEEIADELNELGVPAPQGGDPADATLQATDDDYLAARRRRPESAD